MLGDVQGEQVETGVTSAQKTQDVAVVKVQGLEFMATDFASWEDKSHPSSRPTCTSSKIKCRKHAASGILTEWCLGLLFCEHNSA